MFVRLYKIDLDSKPHLQHLFLSGTHIPSGVIKSVDDIKRENYELVWSGEIADGDLEHVFNAFNTEVFDGIKYWVNVSDVVEVIASSILTPGFYFCDNFDGWVEVPW